MPTTIPPQFQLKFRSAADPKACVSAPGARFTVLTPRLIRVEFSDSGEFEDRASQAIWQRTQSVPPFEVRRLPDRLEIETGALLLTYTVPAVDAGRHAEGAPMGAPLRIVRSNNVGWGSGPALRGIPLTILVKATGALWQPGLHDPANLGGTTRTLDNANGPVHIPPGLVSRSGWAVYDDSRTLVHDEQGWIAPRAHPENLDLYFFGHGHDYPGALRDLARVAGEMPLVPRWALGNWWSRYWGYSEAEYRALIERFQAERIPLSVAIIDMDWHITRTGNECTGWTGYTWNRELFPDPPGFLAWLGAQGLKTSLNIHPAEGVHPHEEQYPEMARRRGIDPASGEPVAFDIPDPDFARDYFEVLHHPQEASGVDFWWLDWQQGDRTRLPGLDPLPWLNHLYFYDLARNGQRPFIFSRWGGLGGHRYCIGFSGDTDATWASLAFQPHFTATAANVGYGWWSHDIGGHQRGVRDPELYTRWVQWGVFSPIMRLHSTKKPYQWREPWRNGRDALAITRDAMQLRHALIPYIYSMNWRCHTQSIPLILPMYYAHPEVEEAYRCPNQYFFGSELLLAPFVTPRDADTGLSRQTVWLPEGDWFDFWSGERSAGGGWKTVYGALEDIPAYAKAGAIVPLGARSGWGGVDNPESLEIHLFPGADNEFELYEDDGETQAFRGGARAVTRLRAQWGAEAWRFTILPAEGERQVLPARRQVTLRLRGIALTSAIQVKVNGAEAAFESAYDLASESLTVSGITLTPRDRLEVVLAGAQLSGRERRKEHLLRLLANFKLEINTLSALEAAADELLAGQLALETFAIEGRARYSPALCG